MTSQPWLVLNCHRDEDKSQKKTRRTEFQKEDYETLESDFPKFHHSRIDDESQSRKPMLTRTVSGKITAIKWKDKDVINHTHKGLLLNPQVQRPNYYHAAKYMSKLSTNLKKEGGLRLIHGPLSLFVDLNLQMDLRMSALSQISAVTIQCPDITSAPCVKDSHGCTVL